MNEETILLAVLGKRTPAERRAYLDEVCASNPSLRRRIEALLISQEGREDSQQDPAADPGPTRPVPVPAADFVHAATEVAKDMAGPDETLAQDQGQEEDNTLSFLEPATMPGSLGRLGHYEVLEVLGRGGFGIVLKAFDEVLHRVVAIKVLAAQLALTAASRRRFLREARASAAIRHEHVVNLYAVQERPIPYLVMEYIAGPTLQQKIDGTGPLSVPEILRIGQQIASGLAAAHARGLIHRDIKPGNILLESGDEAKVKITDFGLARAADDASATQSGVIAGTPMYMAPEQAQGEVIDQRADLFSLGSVLYIMCTGRPPFSAPSTLAVLKRVVEDTPRPIREIVPDLPDWLCSIVTCLHAKKPEDRFGSAQEVADLLARCHAELQATGRVVAAALPPRKRTALRRSWLRAALIGILLTVSAITAVVWQRGLQERAPNSSVLPPADRDGWVPLFNGKDLTGWKQHPDDTGTWRVNDGAIVGSGAESYLFTEYGNFEDFRLRAEAKINAAGDSGIVFRAPFAVEPGPFPPNVTLEGGYEAQINIRDNWDVHTGSLVVGGDIRQRAPRKLHGPEEWFQLEVLAQGNHLQIRINGKTTTDYHDLARRYVRGHIALQTWAWKTPVTVVHFRKIEIKELPPGPKPPPGPSLVVAPFNAEQARAHQEAWAKHLHTKVEIKNSIDMKLVVIPPGSFLMGSPEQEPGREAVEGPRHEVVLTRPCYMGVYEVTVGQFKAFVKDRDYQTDAEKSGGAYRLLPDGSRWEKDPKVNWKNPGFEQTDDHPVVCISWNDARAFCTWLSEKEGETYAMPTEAQWEYGCRAGTQTAFSFGADAGKLAQYGWYSPNADRKAHPVGQLQPNAWGLYDIHGNAGEWTADWYADDAYKSSVKEDPTGPEAGSSRVTRGGNWYDGGLEGARCRSAARKVGHPPLDRGTNIGFRVVLLR